MENKDVTVLAESGSFKQFTHNRFEDGSPRKQTFYKLHPNQDKYPGAIIEMPNLPNDRYHRDLFDLKGYRKVKEELSPGQRVVWSEQWGSWKFDGEKVVKVEEAPQQVAVFKCAKCGRSFNNQRALNGHQISHAFRESISKE